MESSVKIYKKSKCTIYILLADIPSLKFLSGQTAKPHIHKCGFNNTRVHVDMALIIPLLC